MGLFVNKGIKKLLIGLILVLLLGAIFSQAITYINAVQLKNYIIEHDYKLAGYLNTHHTGMSSGIQSVFTSEKSEHDHQTGKALLEQSGYKDSIQLHLIPDLNEIYTTNVITNLLFFIVIGLAVLSAVYLFLRAHYEAIDHYTDTVNKIKDGEISVRLEDSEEGSLPKLAASINSLTASLHTHIEKERHSRTFLKDILTNVSHQLKTPLSALMLYNEIMKDENTNNETVANFLNKSEAEIERTQTLVSKLLKLARLDAGIIELNKKEYVINDIVKQAADSFETRLIKEQKTFEIKAGSKVSYLCDKEWMLEALSNLIKNAVEHTTAGNHIWVQVDETPLMVKITVADDGEGIQPDDLSHIFKRFYRSKYSQNKQGTGIGLTLAKTIIEMHDGFISVESTVKSGTKFTINLPCLQNRKIGFTEE